MLWFVVFEIRAVLLIDLLVIFDIFAIAVIFLLVVKLIVFVNSTQGLLARIEISSSNKSSAASSPILILES